MSVIAEYAVEGDGLVLSPSLNALPDIELDVERSYATDPDRPILFLWADGGDLDAFEAALDDDYTVADYETLSEVDGSRLYRIETSHRTGTVLYPAWVRLGGERLRTRYYDGWWHTRVRFPDRDALSEYREYLDENDVDFQLERLYDAEGRDDDEPALTEQQRETLELAYELGYFDIPRAVTTADLADVLEISNQAVSERLRRGYARLVEDAVK